MKTKYKYISPHSQNSIWDRVASDTTPRILTSRRDDAMGCAVK